MDRAVYTPEELAERWGCSALFVKRLIRSGELPGFYILDKLMRVRAEDAIEFEEKGESLALPENREPCAVYVVRCGDFIKIGKAVDPTKRIAMLQIGNPFELETVAILGNGSGHQLERELHRRFDGHRHKGEWFRLDGPVAEWVAAGCPFAKFPIGPTNLLDCTEPEHPAQEAATL